MEVATGAMSPLLCKLGELLKEEYTLGKKVRKGVKSLETELTMMHAVLRKVAGVPPDQLDEQVRIWAGKVRELSYDMEDAVDAFMVRVEDGPEPATGGNLKSKVKKFLKKSTGLFRKGKDLHQIAGAIEEAQDLAKQLGELRQRYALDIAGVNAGATIDPRVMALYKDVTELVGVEKPKDELIKMLSDGDEESKQRLKTISIVGFGGLGKTTLAKAIYESIKAQFDCSAFVSVSQSPDITKIFKNILYELDDKKYANINESTRDEAQLIKELRRFLENKRYLIVIDDIWDEKVWRFIKCAFTMNNLGSRLITTTRNVSVAEACCSSSDDISYKMKQLSDDDSRRLFYKRIFSHEDECPLELEEVSRDILKKCGGVPLAIITIASLLSSNKETKTIDQWYVLLNSIGHGLANGASVEEMQKILSFSYYELPTHLKTCLLYLSIFPEDYKIPREQLIWKWVAEGFVNHEKQEISLFELGESYFNELINRSMIQPISIDVEGRAEACRVHDMVLDLLCNLSSGENFVTIFDGTQQNTFSQGKFRRLSLQMSMVEPTISQATTSMSQVRSITVFIPAINLMPPLQSFQVLRVLDLFGCELFNLRYIGNLFHLRYLRLHRGAFSAKSVVLPMEIGKLQFLQTLDIAEADIEELPWTVTQLRQLICLSIALTTRIPDGMGNLTFLEVLRIVSFDKTPSFGKELQNLTSLRELSIFSFGANKGFAEVLVESLCNLHKIETFTMYCPFFSYIIGECWVPPPHIRKFIADGPSYFHTMPAWIKRDPLLLLNLSVLQINFRELPQEDLQILGRLPALLSLDLTLADQHKVFIGADGFHCLRVFKCWNYSCGPVFQQGAMPSVENVGFNFNVQKKKDDGNGDFDFGLGNLLSIHHVDYVSFDCAESTVGEVEKAEAALRHAAHVHPNHPILEMRRYGGPTPDEIEQFQSVIMLEKDYP